MTGITHLRGASTSVVIDTGTSGVPSIAWFGSALSDDEAAGLLSALERPVVQAMSHGEAPLSLVPEEASGWMGHPGLAGHRAGLDWAPQFQLASINSSPTTFNARCADERAGLAVTIDLQLVGPDADTLLAQLTVTNEGTTPYDLAELLVTLPLPPATAEVLSFDGRWCHEFATERTTLGPAQYVRENRRGRTSPDRFPGMFVGGPGFGEDHGDVLGAHLAWSANHVMRVDRLADGRCYLQAGELLNPGEIVLGPGESYRTPELIAVESPDGLNTASQRYHRYWRSRPGHPSPAKPRPVTLNTWEAVYFNHDQPTLFALAERAAAVGVERFVLDDGWFGSRRDDTSGLGDWYVDPGQYPEGLAPLIAHVRSLGMEFGLWVEPEMVNPDSDLYRAHPDWMLGIDAYPRPLTRNQLVLDLVHRDAWTYVHDRLDALLRENTISYLKWDMNRDLVQGAHDGRAATHEQTLALYRLLDALRERHPGVEIESCSSGGGRIDAEIAKRTQRFWTSDCNDALERQHIQRGASYFWPPEVLGSHIGPPVAHTTGRRHNLSFRCATAMPYHLGIEWNILEASERDLAKLTTAIADHKRLRHVFHDGDVVRLVHPDPGVAAMAWLSVDRHHGVVSVAQLAMPLAAVNAPVRVPGLEAGRRYRVEPVGPRPHLGLQTRLPAWWTAGSIVLTGHQLAVHGVQLPVLNPESAVLFSLEAAR